MTGLVQGLGIAVCLSGLIFQYWGWLILSILLLIRLYLWKIYTEQLCMGGAPDSSCMEVNRIFPIILLGHLLAISLLALAGISNLMFFAGVAGFLAAISGWHTLVVILNRAAYTRGFVVPNIPIREQC